jgi:hypothetical protein
MNKQNVHMIACVLCSAIRPCLPRPGTKMEIPSMGSRGGAVRRMATSIIAIRAR